MRMVMKCPEWYIGVWYLFHSFAPLMSCSKLEINCIFPRMQPSNIKDF